MSLKVFNPDQVELFTVRTQKNVEYLSVSGSAVSGSQSLYSYSRPRVKRIGKFFNSVGSIEEIDDVYRNITLTAATLQEKVDEGLGPGDAAFDSAQADQENATDRLIKVAVPNSNNILKHSKTFEITRVNNLTGSGFRKIRYAANRLLNHDPIYPHRDLSYKNFHSLNFYRTGDVVKDRSCLAYYNYTHNNTMFQKNATFDFFINPRRTVPSGLEYNAGVVMQLSSSFCISLVTGSQTNENGEPVGFRVMIQTGYASNYSPSSYVYNEKEITTRPADDNPDEGSVFISEDNSLFLNKWSRCNTTVVTKGQAGRKFSQISFEIITNDKVSVTGSIRKGGGITASHNFPIAATVPARKNPMFLGNFPNVRAIGTQLRRFLETAEFTFEGFTKMPGAVTDVTPTPDLVDFTHQLDAEIHDIKIFNVPLTINQIDAERYEVSSPGLKNNKSFTRNLLFFVGPHYYNHTPDRHFDRFLKQDNVYITTQSCPVDPIFSQQYGTPIINLESFCANMAPITNSTTYPLRPRLLHLTSSFASNLSDADNNRSVVDPASITDMKQLSYGLLAKRNLAILPCDNGDFLPTFNDIRYAKIDGEKIVNYRNENIQAADTPAKREIARCKSKNGELDYSIIDLKNTIGPKTIHSSPSTILQMSFITGSANDMIILARNQVGKGGTPYYPGIDFDTGENTNLTVQGFNRSDAQGADNENQSYKYMPYLYREDWKHTTDLVLFEISNLFYGERIVPGSFSIKDSNVTGSFGRVSITLKDNGRGGLYRADSDGNHATWNEVGHIFYEEGLVLVKSPHLFPIGINELDVKFKGELGLHTLGLRVEASRFPDMYSSHESYQQLTGSNEGENFVFISGINFHDENLNVIMKGRLAAPIKKRDSDEITFRFKLDF